MITQLKFIIKIYFFILMSVAIFPTMVMAGNLYDDKPVIIFAAASLRGILNEVIEPFQKNSDINIVISYASSGILARQISHGAPANIYLTANQKWADWLEGKVDIAKNINYLSNRLVLITNINQSKSIYLDQSLADNLQNSRLALGDINHVPAGIYAKAALNNLGLWHGLKEKIAQTMDVRSALMLVERSEAIAGITYKTDAIASKQVKIIAYFPENSHPKIIYKALLLEENNNQNAKKTFNWLVSNDIAGIYIKYGFDVTSP